MPLTSGCDLYNITNLFNKDGFNVELKQTFKVGPGVEIVATTPLNLSALKDSQKVDKIPENSKFQIEAEISNQNLIDYNNLIANLLDL